MGTGGAWQKYPREMGGYVLYEFAEHYYSDKYDLVYMLLGCRCLVRLRLRLLLRRRPATTSSRRFRCRRLVDILSFDRLSVSMHLYGNKT